jgi:hypothetical protein
MWRRFRMPKHLPVCTVCYCKVYCFETELFVKCKNKKKLKKQLFIDVNKRNAENIVIFKEQS